MDEITEENFDEYSYEALIDVSQSYWRCRNAGMDTKSKPLIGALWGISGYRISSQVFRGSLHKVHYNVTDSSGSLVFGSGETASEAMDAARAFIKGLHTANLCAAVSEMKRWVRNAESKESKFIVPKDTDESGERRLQSIPKRRIRIFEASKGRCHYCGTALELTGKWHIEHKMPRALMGSSEPSNLVASCVPCNMKKRDKTDVEFKTGKRAKTG